MRLGIPGLTLLTLAAMGCTSFDEPFLGERSLAASVPAVSFSVGNPTNAISFDCDVEFAGAVAPISQAQADQVTVVNGGSAPWTRIDDSRYHRAITPVPDSLVTVTVPAGLYQDAAANPNLETSAAILQDATAPIPAVTFAATNPTNETSFDCTVQFADSVAPISQAQADQVAVVNGGSAPWIRIDDSRYHRAITPVPDSLVTVTVPAGLYQDAAANPNLGTSASITHDSVSPLPAIGFSVGNPTNAASFDCTVQFAESAAPILQGQADLVTVVNGGSTSWSRIGDYEFQRSLTPTADGLVTVTVPAGLYQDGAANGNPTTSASILHDTTAPLPAISFSVGNPTSAPSFDCTVRFADSATPIDQTQADQVVVANGGDGAWSAVDDFAYQRTITPAPGTLVTVTVPADTYQDRAANWNAENSAAILHLAVPDVDAGAPDAGAVPDAAGAIDGSAGADAGAADARPSADAPEPCQCDGGCAVVPSAGSRHGAPTAVLAIFGLIAFARRRRRARRTERDS